MMHGNSNIKLITFITVTVLAPYVLEADVFGIGICHRHLLPQNRYLARRLSLVFPHFLNPQVA